MEKLKTLQDLKSECISEANKKKLFLDIIKTPYTLSDELDFFILLQKKEAIKWVQEIQSERNLINMQDIPKFVLAEIPKDIITRKEYTKEFSTDNTFQLGMEYGAILIMLKIFDLKEEDLKEWKRK